MQGFLSFLSFLLWVGGGRLMWHRWRFATFLAGNPALHGSFLALCSAGNSSPIDARVHRVLKGWTVDGGHLPPRM